MIRRPRTAPFLALLAMPMIAAACSSSPSSPSSGAAPAARSTTSTTAQVIGSSTMTIGGKAYDVPSEGGGIPIKPYSDTGQQIIYTSSGFLPRTLYASLHTPVVWTNLSPKPLVLTLEHVGVCSGDHCDGRDLLVDAERARLRLQVVDGDAGVVNVGAFGS